MNTVQLSGKITDIRAVNDKVLFATILCKNRQGYEYIPVTIFNTSFFVRHFYEGKYINVIGHIHINKHDNIYHTEIIADELEFCGERTETDDKVAEIFNTATTETA